MIRIALTSTPLIWFPAELPLDDGSVVSAPIYWRALDAAAANAEAHRRLALTRAFSEDPARAWELLAEQTSAPEVERIASLLRAHIVGWEFVDDATGDPIPVTPETLAAVVGRAAWLRPLWSALIDASTAPGLKKSSAPGSAGTPTPTPAPAAGPGTAGAA